MTTDKPEAMTQELKPCAHCGATQSLSVEDAAATTEIPFGYCKAVVCDVNKGGCGVSGPALLTDAEAIAAWNRRAEVQRLSAPGVDAEAMRLVDALELGTYLLSAERYATANCIRLLAAENAALRTVMVAAAEEIHAHWDAHCDAEGYGPANLMRRLEAGISAEYGYTAGAFKKLQNENAALAARVQELEAASAPAVPQGVTKVERGFRWDCNALHHVPTLTVEFTPVPANSPNYSKGWADRDNLAALLSASPSVPKEQP